MKDLLLLSATWRSSCICSPHVGRRVSAPFSWEPSWSRWTWEVSCKLKELLVSSLKGVLRATLPEGPPYWNSVLIVLILPNATQVSPLNQRKMLLGNHRGPWSHILMLICSDKPACSVIENRLVDLFESFLVSFNFFHHKKQRQRSPTDWAKTRNTFVIHVGTKKIAFILEQHFLH